MNAARGEAVLCLEGRDVLLRPSFSALVAAEEEIGPLFAIVERASEGRLALAEMIALFWHCATGLPDGMDRDRFAEAVTAAGLVRATPPLRRIIGQILQGG